MANPRLTAEQLQQAKSLLEQIRNEIERLSDGDADLRFAYRRRIMTQLQYDERGKPSSRKGLKKKKVKEQNGLCAECQKEFGEEFPVLDRRFAPKGYTMENTKLICKNCDDALQKSRKYCDVLGQEKTSKNVPPEL